MTIDFNGDVILCCNDWEKTAFGNILFDPLNDINNNKYRYLMSMRFEENPKNKMYPCFRCEHGKERE